MEKQQIEQTSKLSVMESSIKSEENELSVLKNSEPINFDSEGQSSLYSDHQRTLNRSSCVTMPTLVNSFVFIPFVSLNQDIHPPVPMFCQKNSTSTDLKLSSDQFSATVPCTQLNAYHSVQNVEHMSRPLFRFSHWESALRHCSCVRGCQHCLSDIARRSPSSSPTLDRHIEVSKAKLPTKDSRKSCVGTELPRLESAVADTLQTLSLQAQRLNITRRLPKFTCSQKRAEIDLQSSTSVLPLRHRKEVPCYADPLVGGLPSFHRRLAQMTILVTETIRCEKEKALKSKSRKNLQ
ncbi:uncharacterized protein LOC135331932 isoform X3 [Halichondria panicea]|uniref:uncharacterized protein LOC135331932 isoform X3 n=1 Tax=Halichondria panicea TaxID=6063 RepID=UPI00312B9810